MRVRRSERGFSLPELLVVIGIIGLFALMAIPAFRDFLQAFKVRTSATQIQGIFRLGRQVAVARKGTVIVEITGTTEKYNAAVDANSNNTIDANEEPLRPIVPIAQGVDIVQSSATGGSYWEDAKFALASNGTVNRVGCGSGCNETEWNVLLRRVVNAHRKDEYTITISRAGKVKLVGQRIKF